MIERDDTVENIIAGWKQTNNLFLSKASIFSEREWQILSSALQMYEDMHKVSGLEVEGVEGGRIEEWEYRIIHQKLNELWGI